MTEFEHDASFKAAEASGHLQLDRYETAYQEIFSEALEDGVITADERQRLDRAARSLGLDTGRLAALEQAMRGAYEAHHGHSVLDTSRMFAPRAEGAAPSPEVAEPPPSREGDQVQSLRARIAYLEGRVRELEAKLEEARSQVSYEVDFSDLDAPVPSVALAEPTSIHRRLRHDPRNVTTLHQLYAAYDGDVDRQLCIAQALVFLGEEEPMLKQLVDEHGSGDGLIHPTQALDAAGWRRLLFHPDDDTVTSDILAVIVSAVLLAHSGAMKRSGKLPEIAADRLLDPATSTVQAARCFGWAAQAFGMSAPQLYASPDESMVASMIPTVPPLCALGKLALSGRSANELAFVAGQQLAYYRPERFVRLLVPDIVQLQDMFLAALTIGNPKLPLNAEVRGRVKPIADAVEPLLEATEVDKLRAAYRHFVEHGGVANLQRWAVAADLTAVRAGFALSGDLKTAERMLALTGAQHAEEAMDDLIVFVTGDRYAQLREAIGVRIGT
jgi:hypothetical protein